MKKTTRTSVLFVLALALVLNPMASMPMDLNAAAKPTISKQNADIYVGSTKKIKVKSPVSGSITVKSQNTYVAEIAKVKKTVKKNSPAYFKVKGVTVGYTTVTVKLKLKRKLSGKKKYTFTVNIGVSEKPADGNTEPDNKDEEYFTVTYKHNLDSSAKVTGMPNPLVVKVSKNGSKNLTLPSKPTCEGYTFNYWYIGGEKKPGDVITVERDIIIEAKFSKTKYTIKYDTGSKNNSAIKGSISDSTVEHGNSFYVTSTKPTWEGHTFKGWKLSGSDTIYNPGQKIEKVTKDLTFTAVWDANEDADYVLTDDERAVYNKLIAKKSTYPQDTTWTDDTNVYKWYAFNYAPKNTTVTGRGCVAFACILSDAVFGECTASYMVAPARQIDSPSSSDVKIGDIIRFNNDSHSAIVIAKTKDQFVLAEGNYNSKVNWGRKIPMTTKIDFLWTRWADGSTLTPAKTSDVEAAKTYYTVKYTHNLSSDKIVTGMPDPLEVHIPIDGDHKLTLPAAPSYPGYYLDAWIYKNDYRKNPGDVVTVDKDMTIKAYFKRSSSNGYIIQYDTGGTQNTEIRGVINGVLLGYGDILTITSQTPSWEGHTFSGWRIKGYSTIYQPGQEVSGINQSLTFYAVWDEDVDNPVTDEYTPTMSEAEVLERMLALKETDYPEDLELQPGSIYDYNWYHGRTILRCSRAKSIFLRKVMDAGFMSNNKLSDYVPVTYYSRMSFNLSDSYVAKIGDIVTFTNDHDSEGNMSEYIILGYDGDDYVCAEANDNVVHWNTKVPKMKRIESVYTRW